MMAFDPNAYKIKEDEQNWMKVINEYNEETFKKATEGRRKKE